MSPRAEFGAPLMRPPEGEGVQVEGPPGKSAYEVWVSDGHVGSVEDFLESLRGEPGASSSGEPGASAYESWLELGHTVASIRAWFAARWPTTTKATPSPWRASCCH